MPKYKKVFCLSMLASAVMLSACQPKQTESKEKDVTGNIQVAEQQLKLIGDNEKLKLNVPDCDGKDCPEINIERLSSNQSFIDEFIDQKILALAKTVLAPDAIESVLVEASEQNQSAVSEVTLANVETPKQKLEKLLLPYMQSFFNLDKELKILNASHSISMIVKPNILSSGDPLATVVLNSSSYLGGAHGSSSQSFYNFNLDKKQYVKLDDIVISKQKANLEKQAHEAFKAWVIDSKLATNVAEYEQAWPFTLTDNFYLSKQGLVLQYAEYEIGPYVVGLPKLVIPYDQLQGVLKQQYLPKVEQAASEAKPSVKAN